MERLQQLYADFSGHAPLTIDRLPGAGSNRVYYRLSGSDGTSVIGVIGNNLEENRAFVYLSKHFADKGLPVPRVFAVSADEMCYLQQDLGSRSLYDALSEGRTRGEYSEYERELLSRTIKLLPRIQVLGAEGLHWENCYPQQSFDRQGVMFDLNYFKFMFVKLCKVEFNEVKLEADFERFADILEIEGDTFLYRDFQARNVMLDSNDNPYFIDFQGGRRGPVYYDLASFLFQASAHYSDELRDHLLDVYFKELETLRPCFADGQHVENFRHFVAFRTLQVLGTYGYRGYFERKQYFLNSIPHAIENLKACIAKGCFAQTPYLERVCQAVIDAQPEPFKHEGLIVRVFSFSYKKGIPEDVSGNGGGYVFDCRATNNPGRYREYKHVTGLDQPVIDFLENDGEILRFLDGVYPLVDFHVQRWIDRGFTDLQISFGCTGGQHRSVYCAQHVAEHINEKFGVEVRLVHRERNITHTFKSSNHQITKSFNALVFAAGLGTRLKPLTDTMPKALVPVGGKPLLLHVLEKLQNAGATEVVVNVHHFANQIKDYIAHLQPSCSSPACPQPAPLQPASVPLPLRSPLRVATAPQFSAIPSPSISIKISDETAQLLETGGGLKRALPLFSSSEPILIHNVDILSNIDLREFYAKASANDVTLLVSERKTSRYLLFNPEMRLVGWTNIQTGEIKSPFPEVKALERKPADASRFAESGLRMLAFSGIHCVARSIENEMQAWPSRFAIMDFYLASCARIYIKGVEAKNLQLMDVGKLDTLDQAESFLKTINQKS